MAVDTGAIATDPEMPAGAHELVIEVADAAGNTTTERLAVELDGGGSADLMPTLGCSTGRDTSGALIVLPSQRSAAGSDKPRRRGNAICIGWRHAVIHQESVRSAPALRHVWSLRAHE